MNKIKVLLVEDHTMTRMGLVHVLKMTDNIEVVAEAENGLQGVELAKKLIPDVILMDIGLPEMDGIKATEAIKKANISSKVLIFTSRDNEDDVFDSLGAGADGYIMKGASESQLVSAIVAVNDGTAWLDPQIAKMVLSNVQRQNSKSVDEDKEKKKDAQNTFGLTERELDILALIVDGLQNQEIADKLFITLSTAKAHVHSILQKLYCKTRVQATMLAVKEGLV